jgi:hypothetical protein
VFQVAKATVIPQGKVGIVTGRPTARRWIRAVCSERQLRTTSVIRTPSCLFLREVSVVRKVDILTPGTYRILTQSMPLSGGTETKPGLFYVRLFDATVIDENQIGLVEALDGAPLNPGDYVAESIPGHDNFQDGHEFIDSTGQRGPQKGHPAARHVLHQPAPLQSDSGNGEGGETGRGCRDRFEHRQRSFR